VITEPELPEIREEEDRKKRPKDKNCREEPVQKTVTRKN